MNNASYERWVTHLKSIRYPHLVVEPSQFVKWLIDDFLQVRRTEITIRISVELQIPGSKIEGATLSRDSSRVLIYGFYPVGDNPLMPRDTGPHWRDFRIPNSAIDFAALIDLARIWHVNLVTAYTAGIDHRVCTTCVSGLVRTFFRSPEGFPDIALYPPNDRCGLLMCSENHDNCNDILEMWLRDETPARPPKLIYANEGEQVPAWYFEDQELDRLFEEATQGQEMIIDDGEPQVPEPEQPDPAAEQWGR